MGSLDLLLTRKKKKITMTDLFAMATQTAAGMTHLEEQKLVHRDLALRNLLVTVRDEEKYVIKVADFGLSRITRTIPVKWCAIESLEYRKFSSKSDVWSFGVVL